MKINKQLTRLLCALLCLSLCLSACKKNDPTTAPATGLPKDAIYTITVKTVGGMVLDGVVAYVYEDNTEDDLLTYGTLDNNGTFTFTATESDKYTVRFANLPKEGYDLKEYYEITGTTTNIVLTSSVITDKELLEPGKTYALGDVMRDFSITTADGQELTLSEILKEKDAVVLNFWFTGCDPCKTEFPLLQDAYESFGDKLEVITMNPTDISGDDVESILAFQEQCGLTMPMGMCTSQWFSAFGISAYPTTVIIDRYGVICLVEQNSITDEGVFEAAFAHFTAEDYQQKLVGTMDDLYSVEYAVGHPKNPFQAHGGMEAFEVTVSGNSEYHALLFRGDGMILRIKNPDIYLIVDDVRHDPDANGVIEVEIENPDVTVGTRLIIGNTTDVETVVKVTLELPRGTFNNPYETNLGQKKVTVKADNEQGVYYSWVANADGVLTVTVTKASRDDYDIQLYNLTSYAVRNLREEELLDEDGNRYVSIKVTAGDVVSIGYMGMPDENYNYSEVTITSKLTYSESQNESPAYSVTVKNEDGEPMAGVSVSVMVNGVETIFISDETGYIALDLPSGIYTVKVLSPEGYVCDTAQFLLTDTNPSKEIVLKVYVPQEVPYTVYVVDETGAPVADAMVVLGGSFYYTDADGMVSVIMLESNNYVATVVAPEGYTLANGNFAFGSATSITVVVYRETETLKKADYTVNVVDQHGNAFTNVLVRVESEDGSVSETKAVDANGRVRMNLPETYYTVTVLFNGSVNLGYETTTAKLTPDQTTLTIELVPFVSGTTEEIFVQNAYEIAYYVNVGSVYVDLTNITIRYFLFTPQESGIYTITTTNPEAALGYWGTHFYTYDGSAAVVDNVYTVEIEEVGSTMVLAVNGGEGITGTVLKITRVSDVHEDPEHIVYEGETVPTEPFVVEETGKKTYLDLSVEHTLVKGSDGYYHWNDENGPIVYMDLIGERYGISIAALLDVTSMHKCEFDHNSKLLREIDYTECMLSYVRNVDKQHGVYALTDDLITMIQGHGETAGWFDTTTDNYIFGDDIVWGDSAWMFLLCTFR